MDASLTPRKDEWMAKISRYYIINDLDLENAYHKIMISEDKRCYLVFETCGKLPQFRQTSLEITTCVARLQRIVDKIIFDGKMGSTSAHIDNITIHGASKDTHD